MTPRYRTFLAPLRPTSQIWRLVLGLLLIFAVYFGWMLAMGLAFWALSGGHGFARGLTRLDQAHDPQSVILLMATFAGGWLGVWLTLRWLHRLPLRSLLGRAPVVLRDFALGATMMAAIGGGAALLALPFLPPVQAATPFSTWAAFLPLALLGLLLQTGAEELVFRGYVQGVLAARGLPTLVWMGVPSILFGMAHFTPQAMGANVWIVVASTALFGLAASDLTARSGALGLAWGLHFANNLLAIVILSATGALDGLALWRLPAQFATAETLRPLLLSDIAITAAVWLGCRLWLRRR